MSKVEFAEFNKNEKRWWFTGGGRKLIHWIKVKAVTRPKNAKRKDGILSLLHSFHKVA